MHLQTLQIVNFRNYEEAAFDLDARMVCLVGPNGCGKTNFLDAIHYLSFTKGAMPASDAQSVRQNEAWFSIKGVFCRQGHLHEVVCAFQQQKKTVSENQTEYTRLSEHFGKYPVVMILPQNMELIGGGSEVRRRFFDTLLSQIDRAYLQHLIVYTHALKQRNALLQLFAQRNKTDYELLAQYTGRMIEAGLYLHAERSRLLTTFLPRVSAHYQALCQNAAEGIAIHYRSEAEEQPLADLFERSLERDRLVQRTTSGIHRDDYVFELGGREMRKFGSQGQQKSFLIALKLAEYEMLAEAKGFKPILLLDDIFDKLDDQRMHQLLETVAASTFGQIFITDARPDRSRQMVQALPFQAQFIDFRKAANALSK